MEQTFDIAEVVRRAGLMDVRALMRAAGAARRGG
jgi:hypothetical protein